MFHVLEALLSFFSNYIRNGCKCRPRGEIRELAKGGNKNLLFMLLGLLSYGDIY